jgi:hypothetical protein
MVKLVHFFAPPAIPYARHRCNLVRESIRPNVVLYHRNRQVNPRCRKSPACACSDGDRSYYLLLVCEPDALTPRSEHPAGNNGGARSLLTHASATIAATLLLLHCLTCPAIAPHTRLQDCGSGGTGAVLRRNRRPLWGFLVKGCRSSNTRVPSSLNLPTFPVTWHVRRFHVVVFIEVTYGFSW